jgi:hypothetical protein
LPEAVRFIFAWITNDIGKIPLVLQVIVGPISALVTIWQYVTIRGREPVTMSHRRTT